MSFRIFSPAVALVIFSQSALLGAEYDWPQWQGPARNAISQETGLLQEWPEEGPPLAWKITGLGGGDSTPSIANGRIYGMSHRGEDEVVWALSEKDGQEIWVKRLGPAFQQGMRQSQEGPASTPTIDGDRLYVLGLSGNLACLKVADGALLWQRSLTNDFGGRIPTWSYRESPLIDGHKVICTPGGTEVTLVALDKMNGETIWKSKVPDDANAGNSANNGAGRSNDGLSSDSDQGSALLAGRQVAESNPGLGRQQGVFGQLQGQTQRSANQRTSTDASASAPKPAVLIPAGSTWKYLDIGSAPAADWITLDFKDDRWKEGVAQFGYGDDDEKTKISDNSDHYPAYYFRHKFEVQDPDQLKPLILRLIRDDGAVVYLNGRELWRDNMPEGTVTHNSFASGAAFVENEYNLKDIAADQLVVGWNVLAVQVHQASATSSDVSFDLEFREKIPGVDVVQSAEERRRARFGRRRGGGFGRRGFGSSGAGYASIISIDFEGKQQYVQLTSKALVGVDANAGDLLWRYDRPANRGGINCTTPLYLNGHVFAASAYGAGGGMVKLSKNADGGISAEEAWFSSEMENHHGGVVLVDGCLYGANGGNGGGYLACLDVKTGEVLWNESDRDKRRVTKGSVMVADGRLYYRTERGTLILIEPNPNEYVERGRFEQLERSSKPAWSHPVVANGKLYVRDQDVLFCYDVKAK